MKGAPRRHLTRESSEIHLRVPSFSKTMICSRVAVFEEQATISGRVSESTSPTARELEDITASVGSVRLHSSPEPSPLIALRTPL